MYELFTDDARKVIALANREAQRLNHEYIGTEHLLLGLLNCTGAASIFKDLGLDIQKIRSEIDWVMQHGPDSVTEGRLSQTPRAKNVIGYAIEEFRRLKHDHIGVVHLLWGLIREHEGVAAQVLMNQGLTLKAVHEALAGVAKPVRPSIANRLPADIQDLPTELQHAAADLDAEIRRLTTEKEQAVGERNFETAAALRDRADELKRRKKSIVRDWIDNRPIEVRWLSENDAAVAMLAWRINDDHRWQDLPLLADALEGAGCTDRALIDHCRQHAEHSKQCWVLDLILAH